MTPLFLAIAVVLGAYLVGSIPIGLLLARDRGIDIREHGSGNIGATNVARNLGKKLGAVVLILDAAKGAVPLLVCKALELDIHVDPLVLVATGFAAIAGHCFPIWLSFRGGKGVATAFGVYLALGPVIAGLTVGVFALVYIPFRIVSIGSMTAAIAFPVLLVVFGRSDASVTLGIAVALLILQRHRGNISRLLERRENPL